MKNKNKNNNYIEIKLEKDVYEWLTEFSKLAKISVEQLALEILSK